MVTNMNESEQSCARLKDFKADLEDDPTPTAFSWRVAIPALETLIDGHKELNIKNVGLPDYHSARGYEVLATSFTLGKLGQRVSFWVTALGKLDKSPDHVSRTGDFSDFKQVLSEKYRKEIEISGFEKLLQRVTDSLVSGGLLVGQGFAIESNWTGQLELRAGLMAKKSDYCAAVVMSATFLT